MTAEPIITNLADCDYYKISMQNFYLHRFPNLKQRWKWKCRSEGISLAPFADEIREEINSLEDLRYSKETLEFLQDKKYLKSDYFAFLKMFRLFPRDQVQVSVIDGQLDIQALGAAVNVSPYELYVLPIVSEVYTRNVYPNIDYSEGEKIIDRNIEIVNKNSIQWSCFGTRRRANKAWQERVTVRYKDGCRTNFMGTSNILLAQKHNVRAIGTMGHEIFQSMQALVPPEDSQRFALENWVQEYRGDLGIALTDIFGMDAFLQDFDLYFAKLFDGLRHDSGDPFEWGNKAVAFYRAIGVDPRSKTAVFSDSNTFERAADIRNFFEYTLAAKFGIGTKCTNDLGSKYPPLQHVMKVIEAGNSLGDMRPVAKVPDSLGKEMCEDKVYENYIRHIIAKKVSRARN